MVAVRAMEICRASTVPDGLVNDTGAADDLCCEVEGQSINRLRKCAPVHIVVV